MESRAAPFLAFHRDVTAMQLDEFAHQSQPDAGPFEAAAPRAFHAMEAIEQVLDLGRRNADAGVAHRQPRRAIEFAQRHADLALEGELERVGNQVENDLLPHVAIDIGDLTERRRIDRQTQPGLVRGRPERRCQIGGQRREIRGQIAGLRPAGLDPREIEQ